jgi:predicted urease superfamily metal-dependent hydrolase
MISSEMKIKMQNQIKTKKSIVKTKQEIQKVDQNNRKQMALQSHIDDMPNPLKFVEQKNEAQKLQNYVSNIERKIEIATVAAKEARAVIREARE